ncbi:MAG: GSU2403 family nucleotidyltransferase fold protein [bacterium]
MERMDLAVRTLCAEFREAALARVEMERGMHAEGTFARKRVKGATYWYMQRYEDGVAKQVYFGPSNPNNDTKVEAARAKALDRKKALSELVKKEQRLAAMLRRGGLPSLDRREAQALSALSDAGLAHKHGVLIGTQAFAAYSCLLGAIFAGSSLRTNDIDIVSEPTISVALPRSVDILAILRKTGLNFHEVPALSAKYPSSSFLSAEGLRVDLLTPLAGRPRGNVKLPNISGAGATPLPFLDFLIKDAIDAVLIGPGKGIAVTVPNPARFAVHKLAIAARRPSSEAAKTQKDLEQAAELIAVLAEERPTELATALRSVARIGGKFKSYLEKGRKMLPAAVVALL